MRLSRDKPARSIRGVDTNKISRSSDGLLPIIAGESKLYLYALKSALLSEERFKQLFMTAGFMK